MPDAILIYHHAVHGTKVLNMDEAKRELPQMEEEGGWEHIASLDAAASLRRLLRATPLECAKACAEMLGSSARFDAHNEAMTYDYNRTRLLLEQISGKEVDVGHLWELAADLRDRHGTAAEREPYHAGHKQP